MKLLSDRILVEPIINDTQIIGVSKNKFRAKVIEIGVKVERIKPGHTVVYHEFAGEPWIDGKLLVLRESKDIKSYF